MLITFCNVFVCGVVQLENHAEMQYVSTLSI